MNVIIKRRQLILATMVVALGAAVFVNWYYTGNNSLSDKTETTSAEYVQNLGEAKYVNAETNTDDYFAKTRLSHKKSNDAAMEKLNKSLGSASAGTDEAKSIAAEIDKLTNSMKTEETLENLIGGKIGGECLVIISNTSAEIIVEKGVLNDETALKIMDAVTRNSDLDPTKVTISEPKQ